MMDKLLLNIYLLHLLKGSGYHRYQIILYGQTHQIDWREDIKVRENFNLEEFVERFSLIEIAQVEFQTQNI